MLERVSVSVNKLFLCVWWSVGGARTSSRTHGEPGDAFHPDARTSKQRRAKWIRPLKGASPTVIQPMWYPPALRERSSSVDALVFTLFTLFNNISPHSENNGSASDEIRTLSCADCTLQ